MAMTKMEKDAMVKKLALASLSIPEDAGEIGPYTYAVPVGAVDGEERYAKVAITALNNKDTKTTAAFDFEQRVADYQAELEDKRKEAERKAEEKARKSAKK